MRLLGLVLLLAVAQSARVAQEHTRPVPITQKEYDQRVQEENKKHNWGEGDLRPGQPAPDFELRRPGSDQTVRLSMFKGNKPVALIFGTYSCPIFRGQFRAVNDLADMYKNQVEFILVYVREAHPVDGLQVEENVESGVLVKSPQTLEEKQALASSCLVGLNIKFTALVDGMDNKVEQAYSAWPTRLYLIAKDGTVAWKSKPGPAGFVAAELAVAVENELER